MYVVGRLEEPHVAHTRPVGRREGGNPSTGCISFEQHPAPRSHIGQNRITAGREGLALFTWQWWYPIGVPAIYRLGGSSEQAGSRGIFNCEDSVPAPGLQRRSCGDQLLRVDQVSEVRAMPRMKLTSEMPGLSLRDHGAVDPTS